MFSSIACENVLCTVSFSVSMVGSRQGSAAT